MFELTRRGILAGAAGLASLATTGRWASTAAAASQSRTVRTGPAAVAGRTVTFTGRVDPAAADDGREGVAFAYADYNDFWTPTEVTPLSALDGAFFSITTRVPYSGTTFPYVAFLVDDADAEPTPAVGEPDDDLPGPRGEIRLVDVPSAAESMTVETVDVEPNGTTARLRGRIADFGTATSVRAGAEVSDAVPDRGPLGYSLAGAAEKAPGDRPTFELELGDLEPDTEYEVRASAAVPAGPISDATYGGARRVRIDGATGEWESIRIRSTGEGVAAYEFAVSGDLRPGPDAEEGEAVGRTARGHVGPDRGADAFEYRGELTGFVLAGPAEAVVGGERVDPGSLPPLRTRPREDDFAARRGSNTVRVESTGDGVAAYELAVDGDLAAGDEEEETVSGAGVRGHVGPDRGSDEFAFAGEVTRFRVAGPADVFLNGEPVRAQSGVGGWTALSITSAGEGVAAYEFAVSGDLRAGGDAESGEAPRDVDGRATVGGHLGPDRGRDEFEFTGDIVGLTLAGPARLSVDGAGVAPSSFPPLPSHLRADDFSPRVGTNTVEIASEGEGMAAYELAVTGELRAGADAEETPDGSRVRGHLGPDRGRDEFEFTGAVTEFRLAGPAAVSLNGRERSR